MKDHGLKYSEILQQKESSPWVFRGKSPGEAGPDLLRMVHELEVYRAEIEMQNQQLRQSEAQVRRIYDRYNAMFEQAPSGCLILDREGEMVELNLAASQMLGQERGQLTGSSFLGFVAPETLPLAAEFLREIFEKEGTQRCEIILRRTDHTSIYLYLEGVQFGDQPQCLVTAVDITQRREVEKALVESETRLRDLNATKDKFLSIISHDLKSPFTSIIGLSSLLMNKVKEQDHQEVAAYAGFIQESAHRAMDLLDNLLKWSCTQTGRIHFHPQPANLNALVHETIGLLRDSALQKNIRITRQMPENLEVHADVTMVSTILRNLLSNAIKFTHPGGRVTLSARRSQGELLVAVSDTGIGMCSETRGKLFKAVGSYSTRGTLNESGTGLGLLLAKEFILMHGGNIWVESEPAKGSTFFFTLPEQG